MPSTARDAWTRWAWAIMAITAIVRLFCAIVVLLDEWNPVSRSIMSC